MSKKLPPEEELEKQYRDYKAQFEQWKEKNKGSEGTEGYIKYVRDFEKWEKEVELRRVAVRQKAEQDRRLTSERSTVQEEQQQTQDEASVAARYAKEQQQYMAMHLRGIQDQERQQSIQRQKQNPIPLNQQSFNAVPPPDQQHLFQNVQHKPAPIYPLHAVQTHRPQILEQPDAHMPHMNTIQQPANQYDIVSSMEEAIRQGPHIRADPQPSAPAHQPAPVVEEPRPTLWGSDGADYPPTDSMFHKWGLRALPPNLKTPYQPPKQGTPITPCWYLMNKMEEKGLFYGHNVNLYGIPEVIPQEIPVPNLTMRPPIVDIKPSPLLENGHHRAIVPNGAADPSSQPNVKLPDFSKPPPVFNPNQPPPQIPSAAAAPPIPFNSTPAPTLPAVIAPLADSLTFNVPPPATFRV